MLTLPTVLTAVADRQQELRPSDQIARLDRFKFVLPRGGCGKLVPMRDLGPELELTELARDQLLARLGIPAAYYDRCPPRLQREHVRWFMAREGAKRPVRLRIVRGDVDRAILTVRGLRVMLDADLAAVYGTTVKRLNEQVRRNAGRFPEDFVFTLTMQEWADLRSQFATSSSWGGRRYPPNAFTEHGAVALASVLNTAMAVQASVLVVRAFVRMRHFLATQEALVRRVEALAEKLDLHDVQLALVFEELREIRSLMAAPITSAIASRLLPVP